VPKPGTSSRRFESGSRHRRGMASVPNPGHGSRVCPDRRSPVALRARRAPLAPVQIAALKCLFEGPTRETAQNEPSRAPGTRNLRAGLGLRWRRPLVGERDGGGVQDGRAALEWIGWHGEGSLLVRRYNVQLFCWYTLPRKFLTSIEHKREAAALARVLEQFGGRAATYAAVCRSSDARELLEAWAHDERSAWPRFRKLLDDSGLEPPDRAYADRRDEPHVRAQRRRALAGLVGERAVRSAQPRSRHRVAPRAPPPPAPVAAAAARG
jgi:hypothetical protein